MPEDSGEYKNIISYKNTSDSHKQTEASRGEIGWISQEEDVKNTFHGSCKKKKKK